LTQAKNASSLRSLAEPLVPSQRQHAGLSPKRDPKYGFDCFSVTATFWQGY